jgi:hypothetical protein
MVKWPFSDASESKIPLILSAGSVGYLSASCCNPAAVPDDEQLTNNVKQAMNGLGLDLELHKETLTHAQASLPSAVASLDEQQTGVINKVMTLFSTRGLEAFPMLFIDGDLAFYGGTPSTEEITQHMRSRLLTAETEATKGDSA